MLTTEVLKVTPETAKNWLKRNTTNRAVSKKTVSKYAEDIKKDNWVVNGEAIKFTSDGVLVDGQHRLHAIIEADRSIETLVAYNVPDEAFATFDTGRKRSAGDVLKIAGFADGKNLAAAIKVYLYYQMGCLYCKPTLRHIVTNNEILRFAESNPQIISDIYEGGGYHNAKKIVTSSVLLGLYPYLIQANKTKTLQFYEILDNGALDGFPAINSVSVLRNKLLFLKRDGMSFEQEFISNLFTVAWNNFYDGKIITKLYASSKIKTLRLHGVCNIT